MITELGHAGLWVSDLSAMRAFYQGLLGLTVTDESDDPAMVFLSSRPKIEHHELVLAIGRREPGASSLNQLSWRLNSLDSLLELHRRFVAEGVTIRQTVTHGNALGIYFEDPEGNVNEVYWPTGEDVPQPFRKSLDMDAAADHVLAQARMLLAEPGSTYHRTDHAS